MSHWKQNLENISRYTPTESSYWHDVELCYDKMTNNYCIATEIRGMDGIIRYVSDDFAKAFVKEFGLI